MLLCWLDVNSNISYETSLPPGLSQVQSNPGLVVFHSGVARGANGSLVTWGGRVLLVCARAGSLRAAAAAATAAASVIDFPGAQYRKDIAHRAFSK